MRVTSIEAIVDALNSAGVPYLVVGGLAVNAHGHGRATFDIDLVVELSSGNVNALFQALGDLGYRPLVPVTAAGFGDRSTRERWIDEKGMVVLQFYSDSHRETRVDVFTREPFDFQLEYDRALVQELRPGLPVRIVALDTLIALKRAAGRAKDLDDIENLERLAAGGGE
jgi:hypothetical protein